MSIRGPVGLILALIAVAVFTMAVILVRVVGGGEKTFLPVAGILKTNSYVLSRVGSPVTAILQDVGPWRVDLELDGHRQGFYSVTAEGPKGREPLKAYWRELPNASVEVYALYRMKAWTQDELVWGEPRPELH
jgi:hypothetical protein